MLPSRPSPGSSREDADRVAAGAGASIEDHRLSKLIARGASGSLALRVVSTLLMLVVQIVLARLMGVESFGVYVYAISWMNLFVLVAKMGLDNTLLRFVADYRSRGRWGLMRGLLTTSHRVTLLASTVLVVVVVSTAAVGRERLGDELSWSLILCGAAVPFLALSGLRRATLRSLRYVVLSQVPESALRPLLLLALLFVAWRSWSAGVTAPLASFLTLMAAVASFAVGDWWLRRRMPAEVVRAEPERALRLWGDMAFFLLIASFINMLMHRVDILIIGAVLGAREVGIYAPASRLSEILEFGLNATNMVAAPLIAEYHARRQPQELQRVVTLSGYGILAYTVPVTAGLIVAGRPLLGLFGEGFAGAYPVLVVLAAGHLANALTGPVSFVMSMTGAQRQLMVIMGSFLLVNILGTYLLLPRFGVIGAALATAVAMIGANVLATVLVYRRFGVSCFVVHRLPRRHGPR